MRIHRCPGPLASALAILPALQAQEAVVLGRVLSEGKPLVDVRVAWRSGTFAEAPMVSSVVTGADGRFELTCSAGAIKVAFQHPRLPLGAGVPVRIARPALRPR